MSIIIKNIFFAILLISFSGIHSQPKKDLNNKPITIYIDLKDKLIEEYSINKDTTSASFSIYYKKYESKTERDKVRKKYKYLRSNPNKISGDPDKVVIPDFSVSLYSIGRKPERLNSLSKIQYITTRQFVDNNSKITAPTYIIHKLENGTYLKWETYTMD